jgi:hypothetical protein
VLCQHKVLRRGYAARTVRWLSWSGLRLAKASFALQALWSLHKFSLGTHIPSPESHAPKVPFGSSTPVGRTPSAIASQPNAGRALELEVITPSPSHRVGR